MSLVHAGRLRSAFGFGSALKKQLKSMTLKPVKKVTVEFDPFHEKVRETRAFLNIVTGPKVSKTNINCVVKTQIVCDRSEPKITFDLGSGDKVEFKSANLDTLDILTLYNKHISSLAPPEQDEEDKKLNLKKKKKSKKPRRPKPRRRRI